MLQIVATIHTQQQCGTTSPAPPFRSGPASPRLACRRHDGSFLVPFVLADELGLQRDLYYAIYVPRVVGLFLAWARETHQSLHEMSAGGGGSPSGSAAFAGDQRLHRRRRRGRAPGIPAASSSSRRSAWRGVVYGAADGLLLSAFPILLVFAALGTARLAAAPAGSSPSAPSRSVASLAMTAVYHAGYSDFRSAKAAQADDRRPHLERADARDAQPDRRADRPRRPARRRRRPQLRHRPVPAGPSMAARSAASVASTVEPPCFAA